MDAPLILRPTNATELAEAIADATRSGARLEICGGGSKATMGAPRDATRLDMTGFAGVIDYDPPELVLTVGAGTPLSQVRALVSGQDQMLAFEPFDHGPIFGRPAGAATIGGVIASGVAGSRRVSRGAARDHLLGFKAVSGRAEAFVGGAKVVKNVTGYDLPKLMTGSWGRLAALTEVTLKVLPRPRTEASWGIEGLDAGQAQAVMARVMGSQAEISAAAHAPATSERRIAMTVLRIEGFGPSVAARGQMIEALLLPLGGARLLPPDVAMAFWNDLHTLAPLADDRPLWRINTPPSAGGAVLERLEGMAPRWLMDWAGGLIWMTAEGDPALVRAAAEGAGGHAALVRAPEDLRRQVPAPHPQAPGVAALEARVRRAFDPAGVFETGRFLDLAHAD